MIRTTVLIILILLAVVVAACNQGTTEDTAVSLPAKNSDGYTDANGRSQPHIYTYSQSHTNSHNNPDCYSSAPNVYSVGNANHRTFRHSQPGYGNATANGISLANNESCLAGTAAHRT